MKKTILWALFTLCLTPSVFSQDQIYAMYNWSSNGISTFTVDPNTGASTGATVNYMQGAGIPSEKSTGMGYSPTNKYIYFIPEVGNNAGIFNVHSVPAFPQTPVIPEPTTSTLVLTNQTLASNTAGTSVFFRRVGINQSGMAYMVVSDANNIMHFARFQTDAGGGVSGFQSLGTMITDDATTTNLFNGDLAFDGNGNMYVLANQDVNGGVTKIYRVPAAVLSGTFTTTTVTTLNHVATVVMPNGLNFPHVVTGLAFSSTGNLFISAQDLINATGGTAGIFMVNKGDLAGTVRATQTAFTNNGFGDLASSYFPPDNILPVHYKSINAKILGGNLIVNWQTSAEISNERFDIEISKDGKSFTKIGSVQSKAFQGNSTSEISYEFSIPVSDFSSIAILGISIFSIAFLLLFANRRNRLLLSVAVIMGAGLFTTSCNKTAEQIDTDNSGKVFVRIAQVDKDGTINYSEVKTAYKAD